MLWPSGPRSGPSCTPRGQSPQACACAEHQRSLLEVACAAMQEFTGGRLAPGPLPATGPKLMPNSLVTHLLLDLLLLAQLILPSLPVLLFLFSVPCWDGIP